jgi:hypothetical protein
MTASAIQLRDFIEQLRSSVPNLHPAGMETIRAWFWEMTDAADHGDAATVARFAKQDGREEGRTGT